MELHLIINAHFLSNAPFTGINLSEHKPEQQDRSSRVYLYMLTDSFASMLYSCLLLQPDRQCVLFASLLTLPVLLYVFKMFLHAVYQ